MVDILVIIQVVPQAYPTDEWGKKNKCALDKNYRVNSFKVIKYQQNQLFEVVQKSQEYN